MLKLTKTIHLVAGLPRKNTAFLAQNRAESAETQLSVMRGVLEGYFAITDKPVCFEKNRMWPEYLEMASHILGGRERLKVIVTVRDLRDVLASFELRYRDTAAQSISPHEAAEPHRFKTALQRIDYFVESGQPVGRAFNAIRDAITRGWSGNMHFVEYDALTAAPGKTLAELYAFLGETPFAHDFDAVEQVTQEDDLHKVRRKIEPQGPSWPKVFDPVVVNSRQWQDISKNATFWRNEGR